jgi:hypothetical protein
MSNVTAKILNRIRSHGRGWVFTPKLFQDLGTRAALDKALSRLAQRGTIRRLKKGLYDFPRQSKLLQKAITPNSNTLASALANSIGDTLLPSGAQAANLLGLSTQIPAKSVFATHRKSKSYNINGTTISFQHSRLPILRTRGAFHANLVIQALAYLGRDNIYCIIISSLIKKLSSYDKKVLLNTTPLLPCWISDIIHQISTDIYD